MGGGDIFIFHGQKIYLGGWGHCIREDRVNMLIISQIIVGGHR